MAESTAFRQHVNSLLARSPELAQRVVEQVQATLRSSNTDITLAQDRNLHFLVSEALQSHRAKFENALIQHIQSCVQSSDKVSSSGSFKLGELRLDQLTLVDEDQAEKEIEISRTVQLIDLTAEWELRELQSFTSVLQGEAALRPQTNPFRPAVYARALSAAARELPLTPNERAMLLRLSGKALALQLKKVYAEACEGLRQQGFKPMPYKAVTTPRRALPHSGVNIAQPGALQSLLERLPASMQLPQRHLASHAQEGAAQPFVASAKASGTPSLTFQSLPEPPNYAHFGVDASTSNQTAGATANEEQLLALLTRLFAQMRVDDELQPAVKTMIGQLQPAVMRMAQYDPSILRSAQHPAWRLINQLASYASGYAETDIAGLNNFINFIQPRIDQLVPAPGPTLDQFQNTLDDVQQFVEQQSQTQLQATPQTVAQLQEADQRLALRPIMAQQIEQQLQGVKLKPSIKAFLLGPWADVLAQAMSTSGADGDNAQLMMATVDDLIQSLQRPRTLDEREALKRSLPSLVSRLQRGMASIEMPQEQQDGILKELMGIHGHHMLATPKAAKATEPTAAELVQQMRDEMTEDEDPRQTHEHQEADRSKKGMDTNIGTLPTVPMLYGDETPDELPDIATPQEWVQALQKGMWCKLFLQGQWTTAHLLWISDNRQFFMFTSNKAGGVHSMTHRALERLRAEGLATNLEDRSLMQRAVDSMLQDLNG